MLIITNNTSFFGQAGQAAFSDWQVAYGGERTINDSGTIKSVRTMSGAIVHEWQQGQVQYDLAAVNVIHELGHNLGSRNHYGNLYIGDTGEQSVIDYWTVMGANVNINPAHFTAFDKHSRGWLPPNSLVSLGPPIGASIDNTITLRSHETQPGGSTYYLRIPFTSDGLSGYAVEARRAGSEDNVQEPGVVVSAYDESGVGPNDTARYRVQQDTTSPGFVQQSALEVGDQFVDAQRNISVKNVANPVPGQYTVRVQWTLPANQRPDPAILAWGAPPWETPDIWIDSERNGYGTFKNIDALGNPTGNGDEPWVSFPSEGLNRYNRLYARVSNRGLGPATNVEVKMYSALAGAGADLGQWNLVGTILHPSIAAGMSAVGYVNWQVTGTEHLCVRAVITTHPDELVATNNNAQENVWAFDTTRGSPWKAVTQNITVRSPYMQSSATVRLVVSNLPSGWSYDLLPSSQIIPPGGSKNYRVVIRPGGIVGGPEPPGYDPGYLGKPRVVAVTRFGDMEIPIGGGEIWTRLVTATSIACSLSTTGSSTLVAGTLLPARAGQKVAVELVKGPARYLVHSLTAANGSYSATFDVGSPTRVESSYDGKLDLGASSTKCN